MTAFLETTKQILTGHNVGLALFFIGTYGLIARRNILKSIISLSIIQAGIVLFFISAKPNDNALAPIGVGLRGGVSDPLPQAMMITAIVIGISVTALSLTMFISLYHKYGSTNWRKVKKRREDQ